MTVSQHEDNSPPPEGVQVMLISEVAALYRVDPKTVARWADRGRLTSFRTPGGHRRFRADEVLAEIAGTVRHREEQQ